MCLWRPQDGTRSLFQCLLVWATISGTGFTICEQTLRNGKSDKYLLTDHTASNFTEVLLKSFVSFCQIVVNVHPSQT